MAGRFSLIESELQLTVPRPVRLTPAGRRKLILSIAPVGAVLASGSLLFFSMTQPRWLEGLFTLFFLAGVGLLFRMISLWRARVDLVAEGIPVRATVVLKEPARGGAARYYCWYEVAKRQWGLGWRGEWPDAEIGDTVTVLYSPEEPGQAVVYRWAGCVVASPAAQPGPDAAHSALNPKI